LALQRPSATAEPRPGARRRRALTAGVVIILLVAGGAAAARYRKLLRPAAGTGAPGAALALAQVVAGPLTSQQQVSGTVQYVSDYASASGASNYPVLNEAPGVLTALPALGQVLTQGQSLYSVSGQPVTLLYGSVPAYRSLSLGLSGQDVQGLNADLVALGYATAAEVPTTSDAFTTATAMAVERLQAKAGLPVTGQLPLGEVLFLPAAIRVAAVELSLGATIAPGQTVLETTSSTEEVVAQVDPSQAEELHAGQAATITFADGTTAPGAISAVANVAISAPSGSGPGGGSAPTVEVDIAPSKPAALSGLDNASVQVSITTASVPQALAVPVTALLAQSGGYALEVEAAGGTHRLIPVQLGIFDDAAGLVQVTGTGLAAGQEVAVAGT